MWVKTIDTVIPGAYEVMAMVIFDDSKRVIMLANWWKFVYMTVDM